MSARSWPLEPDEAGMDSLLRAAATFAHAHVATLDSQPAHDLVGAAELARGFQEPAPEAGSPLEPLLERLGAAAAKSFNTAGPGYLAYIPGGGLYTAALADFVLLALNRYVGVARAAPVLAEIERTVVRWLCDAMG